LGEVLLNADAVDRERYSSSKTSAAMSSAARTTSAIDAMLEHLDGKKRLSDEHARVWRGALEELRAKGQRRKKLDAFADAVGVSEGRAGRPKQAPTLLQARMTKAYAVTRLRVVTKERGREEALAIVAAEYDTNERRVDADILDGWSKSPEIREIVNGIPALRALVQDELEWTKAHSVPTKPVRERRRKSPVAQKKK
jgi:hypothetical protein